MKRFSLFFLLLFVLIVTSFGRTIYVVSVGICDYKYIKDLRNTENDAKSFSQLYLTHTKNIKTLLGSQATHDNILNTLRESFSKASEDDIVVFFFSGHGGKGGLCAYDTKAANTMVTYKEIQKVMDFIGEYEKPHDSLKNDRKIEFDDLREDIPEESLTLEEALMNTYKKKYSYFQVKEFVEQ